MDIWYSVDGFKESNDTETTSTTYHEQLLNKFYNSLLLRNEEPGEIINQLSTCKDEDEAWDMSHNYKLNGVFAISREGVSVQDAFKLSINPQMGISNKYLVEAEADLIYDFGKEYGLLVVIKEIINIYETPQAYIDEKK